MDLTDKTHETLKIISINGNIILEETTQMKNFIEDLIEMPEVTGIILNCENVDYIDSSGLGLIVSIYKTLKQSARSFALTGLDAKTMEIFILTRLNEILTITENEEQAIAACNSQ